MLQEKTQIAENEVSQPVDADYKMSVIEMTKSLEQGKLYMKTCRIKEALETLESGLKKAKEEEDWELYMQHVPIILRVLAEQLEFEKIKALQTEVFSLTKTAQIKTTAKIQYTLGICRMHSGEHAAARDHFEHALLIAEHQMNKEDRCHALFGMAGYYASGPIPEHALQILNELDKDLGTDDLHELKISSLLLRGVIHRKVKNYDLALDCVRMAQQDLKGELNVYTTINVLYGYAAIYQDSGNASMARIYLNLAESLLNKTELRLLAHQIQERQNELRETSEAPYDLVLKEDDEIILYEKSRGMIRVGQQHILVHLLKTFGHSPGRIYSKEELVSLLWKEDYNPEIHDNKIYVTIQRLRKLVEENVRNPKYILKKEQGYCLRETAKFHVATVKGA